MCIDPRCIDVNAEPAGLRQALKHVRCHARLVLQRDLTPRASAEIDRCAGESVVHRNDRVAVAGDSTPVSEGEVECFSKSDGCVLGRVVISRLEIAVGFERQVESTMKAELLEKVIVDAGTRGDANTTLPVQTQSHADAGLGRRAQVAHPSPGGRFDR